MTFNEWLRQELQERGLEGDNLETVLELVKKDEALSVFESRRWDDKIDGYSVGIRASVWFTARQVSIDWIDANLPNAFSVLSFWNRSSKLLDFCKQHSSL